MLVKRRLSNPQGLTSFPRSLEGEKGKADISRHSHKSSPEYGPRCHPITRRRNERDCQCNLPRPMHRLSRIPLHGIPGVYILKLACYTLTYYEHNHQITAPSWRFGSPVARAVLQRVAWCGNPSAVNSAEDNHCREKYTNNVI